MGRPKYRDIEVRGTVYADANAAAAALGVSPQTVRNAVRSGRTHRVGKGERWPEPLPVRVRGMVFKSARAAAEHFGVKPPAIYRAILQGREDRFLLPRKQRNGMSKPITIGPLSFSSMDEAARVLGFKQGYVSRSLRSGRTSAIERILGAAMREARRRQMQARLEGADD